MQVIPIGKQPAKKRTITERHIYTQELIKILQTVKEEETISYEKLSSTIGIDVRPQHEGYSYQTSAKKILERDNDIAFKAEPTVGLRRIPHEEVGLKTGEEYLKRKKAMIKRSKRRIQTIDDYWEKLSPDAQMRVLAHRTILAFDNELSKPKNLLKITDRIREDNKLIGFQDTLKLFEK